MPDRTDLLRRYGGSAEFSALYEAVREWRHSGFLATHIAEPPETALVQAYDACEAFIEAFEQHLAEYGHPPGRPRRGRPRKHSRWIEGMECWRCSMCRQWKPEKDFSRNRATSNGLQSWCRACKADDARMRDR